MYTNNLLKSDITPNDYGDVERFKSRPRVFLSRIGMYVLKDMHEYSTIPAFFEHLEFEESKNIDETSEYLKNTFRSRGKKQYILLVHSINWLK